MKKLTLAIVAVVIGLAMTSCGGESPKESIKKATDEFFTQAENNVQAITSGEEFMNFFENFKTQKAEFTQKTFSPYANENGDITGISESDMEEIQSYIYDRASAYNKVEAAKCAEFMTPAMDRFEEAVDALYAVYKSGAEIDEETFSGYFGNIEEALDGVFLFADYDNIPNELAERYEKIDAKRAEMFGEK